MQMQMQPEVLWTFNGNTVGIILLQNEFECDTFLSAEKRHRRVDDKQEFGERIECIMSIAWHGEYIL